MHRLLKDTGSFYLHCDPTMSHYLKLICDMIFGEKNFRNEIVWQRTTTHNDSKQGAKHFGRVTDTILFYSRNEKAQVFNPIYRPYSQEYIEGSYNKIDEYGRRFKSSDLSAAKGGGDTEYEWKGVKPPPGRFWAYSKTNMLQFEKEGRLYYSSTGKPYLKHYLDEMPGNSVDNLWSDIGLAEKDERLGYPTQKPESLLERIIKASSNEGDVVADFFCGCGTTIAVAQRLNRKWLGADISHLAIRLIVKRLTETYGIGVKHNIKMHGLPKDVASAKMLAQETEGGRIGFQDWAIEVMLNGVVNEKKVADGGYDGYLTFNMGKEKYFAIIETKSGKLTVKNMREFVKVVENQKAAVGIFVCFEENVTKEMIKEAKDAGHIKLGTTEFPMDMIQIITIENLFNGKQPQLPGAAENETFKKAKRNEGKASSKGLFD
jgi:DNA modification methylase